MFCPVPGFSNRPKSRYLTKKFGTGNIFECKFVSSSIAKNFRVLNFFSHNIYSTKVSRFRYLTLCFVGRIEDILKFSFASCTFANRSLKGQLLKPGTEWNGTGRNAP